MVRLRRGCLVWHTSAHARPLPNPPQPTRCALSQQTPRSCTSLEHVAGLLALQLPSGDPVGCRWHLAAQLMPQRPPASRLLARRRTSLRAAWSCCTPCPTLCAATRCCASWPWHDTGRPCRWAMATVFTTQHSMDGPRRSDRKRTQTQFQGATETVARDAGRTRAVQGKARKAREAAVASAYEPLVGLKQLGEVGGGEGSVQAPRVRDHRAPQRPLQWLRWLLAIIPLKWMGHVGQAGRAPRLTS